MARTTAPNGLPLPRSLADHRSIRRELISLYRQTKGGQVDYQLAGRLSHILSVLSGLVREQDLEARLEALESQLVPPHANGAGYQREMRA